jgi:hypothetical protein
MGFDDIKQGLANAALTIDGLSAYPHVPDAVSGPTFGINDWTINYDQVFGHGLQLSTYSCGVFVERGDPSQLVTLAQFLDEDGDVSIKAAIEADLTLGGACKTLSVVSLTAGRDYTIGGTDYPGAMFTVQVWS